MKKLLNQAEFARKHNVSRQRINQILKSGDLLTRNDGKKLLIVNCSFNDDIIAEKCNGTGNFKHESYGY